MLKAFGIVILILSLFTLLIWSQSKNIRTLLDPDLIRIELNGRLLHQEIDIYCKSEGATDSILIYQSSRQLSKSFAERGYNTFSITYEDKFIGAVEHFKPDKDNSYTYYYVIVEDGGEIDIQEVSISGLNSH